MERNQKQQYQLGNGQQGKSSAKTLAGQGYQGTGEVVPGVPVIRSSTPRPLSFDTMASYSGYFRSLQPGAPSTFPERAPSAPPLPEELGEREDENELDAGVVVPPTPKLMSSEGPQEFIWLFEYGLEMDPAILNGHELLEGCALLYGPAVLNGYTLLFGAQHVRGSNGPTTVAIVPSMDQEAEVWGIVYRIPQGLVERSGEQPPLLDTIHAAIAPQNFFKGVQVVVHEIYRDQEISAVTYVATDIGCQELQLVSPDQSNADAQFVQRLTAIARGHKFPQSYVSQYNTNQSILSQNQVTQDTQTISKVAEGFQTIPSTQIPPSLLPTTNSGTEQPESLPLQDRQKTDPLPALKKGQRAWDSLVQKSPTPLQTNWSLVVFSIYLAGLLLIMLTFAVLQGMGFGQSVLTNNFTPLEVPWLVIMYGLLGGCVSSLITLGHLRTRPPLFVVITWFVRPYIGAVLAIFAYILLTSGLFIAGQSVERHMAFFWLVGALAGFCEGWIFFRRG
ncbi:MAG TPA: gamma-glutamylcyclotransferase family protein [Ktedonobacteraceae bacterium]